MGVLKLSGCSLGFAGNKKPRLRRRNRGSVLAGGLRLGEGFFGALDDRCCHLVGIGI